MALEQITVLDEPHDCRATGLGPLGAPRPRPPSVLFFILSARYRGERGDQTSQIGWEGEEIIIFGGTSDWDAVDEPWLAWVTLMSVVSLGVAWCRKRDWAKSRGKLRQGNLQKRAPIR